SALPVAPAWGGRTKASACSRGPVFWMFWFFRALSSFSERVRMGNAPLPWRGNKMGQPLAAATAARQRSLPSVRLFTTFSVGVGVWSRTNNPEELTKREFVPDESVSPAGPWRLAKLPGLRCLAPAVLFSHPDRLPRLLCPADASLRFAV